jgi:sucrose-6-phosphate hydrolase SacC (GH32 family)
MPISIWNDQPYDEKAIYTGSASVVDGKVVQVYPGLCDTKNADCPGGTNLCIAVPADPSDPLQTNWTKTEAATGVVNPVVPAIGRDPSTAWQTPDGEWRLTTFDTMVFGSMDFKHWYRIGNHPGFAHGECPSFFPLPRNTPGAGPAPAGAETPTHVHKSSHGGQDWMNVGTYTPGKPNEVGNFTATAGVPHDEIIIDADRLYASKDFYDPVKKRRINWGWARVPPASTQTLPREVTWNPELQILVHSPIEEQAQLRAGEIGSLKEQTLPAGSDVSLGLPEMVGNQSELVVSFQRPTVATRLAASVMTGDGSPLPAPYAREMPGSDLTGGDYNVTNVDYKDFKICEQACDDDAKCKSWTYVIRGPKYASCCLKGGVPAVRSKDSCTSGVKDPTQSGGGTKFYVDYVPDADTVTVGVDGGVSDKLKLSPSDKTIDMRLFVDNTFTEAYWMGGRVAMTTTTKANKAAGMSVSADKAGITLANAKAWKVGSIWVTPEDVIATPRADASAVVV